MRSRWFAGLLLALGCTGVDATEHCVLTRYGKVVQEKMGTGLAWTPIANATCFSLTDQNWPTGEGEKETVEAQTADPVTVIGDVAIVFKYDPTTVFQLFLDKRSEQAARVEVMNAIREGYRTAFAGWTVAEIFSERRASLSDSVRVHIQRKIGKRAVIGPVFVRDIKIPAAIEQARILAAQQAQILDRAQKQYIIDSVNARGTVISAKAKADAQLMLNQTYERSPAALQLAITEAFAEGLGEACKGVQTCILGGSVMDAWKGVSK